MTEDNFFAKRIKALEMIQTELEKSITTNLRAIDIKQKVLTRINVLIDKLKDCNELTPEDILKTDAAFNEMAEMMKTAKDELNNIASTIKRDQEKKAEDKKTNVEEKKPEQYEAPEEEVYQVEIFDDGTFIVIK